ncbi:helix-hairpin-helix domain-containing protein, partial [Phytoactinopolyspora endophytica]|uniref:helix-hairpin-helix domain-containing protein n=1 Tax=Phytoactinopolyspora endophytica TaxID=1642495 RepID=UPI001F0FD10A
RVWNRGHMVSKVREGAAESGAKFSDYFDFSEPLTKLPSHRALAVFRGEKEEILDLTVKPSPDDDGSVAAPGSLNGYESAIASRFGIENQGRAADAWLVKTVQWAWRTRIMVNLSVDLRMRVRQAAEEEAIRVFAGNLRDLLLAAPAGTRPTMGLDPAYRTGVKVAVVDVTGKVVATSAVYPHKPQGQWNEALVVLEKLAREHRVELVAIGNGTASRETDQLAAELVKLCPDLNMSKIMISEAGASVYSASSFASRELGDLDVSLRGAVSIARRLQDPLAELVKIEPKSIGVGQYQHDLSENDLSRSLDAVVEDCVNAVGVDLNTASTPLLARVSGISSGLAENIVTHRESKGSFRSRTALQEVPRLGPKAFEQSAGFLRIRGGDEPLDASSVHPESYPLARRIAEAAGGDLKSLLGSERALRGLKPSDFVDETYGLPTVTDVLSELEKPGRDPRPSFKTATFTDGVETVADLKPGMRLEGVVTNVAAFGAFVDVGVHQDGLVHISAMSHEFIKDPREVVKPGDVVKVKVLEVDVPRNRISLTLRLDDDVPGAGSQGRPSSDKRGERRGSSGTGSSSGTGNRGKGKPRGNRDAGRGSNPQGAVADALRRAGYQLPKD